MFWEALGDIAPRLKWLRLCIPDPHFNIPGLVIQHSLDAKRAASYPIAASEFISRCTRLKSLVICNNEAERIDVVLSKLPPSVQLCELQIELRGLWPLGDVVIIGHELP